MSTEEKNIFNIDALDNATGWFNSIHNQQQSHFKIQKKIE